MLGENKKEEKLFYYFRLEQLIPENHILRLIDRHVDFSFIRVKGDNAGIRRVPEPSVMSFFAFGLIILMRRTRV